jgi:hypothetical protein
MALSNLQKIGKWDDDKNRHGYDKPSIGILTSPSGLKKLEDTFNRIGGWDFNLYFVKKPNAWKEREKGVVDSEYLRNTLGLEVGKDFPQPTGDQITIIFTNNSAAEQVPLTPWTIAHRIGHSFAATFRTQQNKLSDNTREVSINLQKILSCYGIRTEWSGLMYSSEYYIRDLYQKIGKFRSARTGQLIRPFEFYHETFAYWLLHDGDLDFNEPPKFLLSSNKKAWGNPTGRQHRLMNEDDAILYIDQFKYSLDERFHRMIGEHMGKISIM